MLQFYWLEVCTSNSFKRRMRSRALAPKSPRKKDSFIASWKRCCSCNFWRIIYRFARCRAACLPILFIIKPTWTSGLKMERVGLRCIGPLNIMGKIFPWVNSWQVLVRLALDQTCEVGGDRTRCGWRTEYFSKLGVLSLISPSSFLQFSFSESTLVPCHSDHSIIFLLFHPTLPVSVCQTKVYRHLPGVFSLTQQD